MAYNLVSTGSGVPLTLSGTAGNKVQVGVSNDGSKMAVIIEDTPGNYTLTVYNVNYTNFNNPFSIYHVGTSVTPSISGNYLNADFEQVAVSNNGDHIFVVFNNTGGIAEQIVSHFRWNGSGYDDIDLNMMSFRMTLFPAGDYLNISGTGTIETDITGVVSNNDGSRIIVKKKPSTGTIDEYIRIDVNLTTGALTFAKSGDPHVAISGDDLSGDHRAKFNKDLTLLAYGTTTLINIYSLNANGSTSTGAIHSITGTFQSILGVSSTKLVYMTDSGVYSLNVSLGPIALGAEITLSTDVKALVTSDFTGAVVRDNASLIVVKEQLTNNARTIFEYSPGLYDETVSIDSFMYYPLHVDSVTPRFISMNNGYAFDGSGNLNFYITEVITLQEIEIPEEPLTTGGWAGQLFGNPNNRLFNVNMKNNRGLASPFWNFSEPLLPTGLTLGATNNGSTYDNQIVKETLFQTSTDPGFAVVPYTVTGSRDNEDSEYPHNGTAHALFLAPPTFDLSIAPGTSTFNVLPNTSEGYSSITNITIDAPYNSNYSISQTGSGYIMTLDTVGSLVTGELLVPFTGTTNIGGGSTIKALLKVTNTNGASAVEPIVEPTSLPLKVGGVVGTSTVTTLPINYNGNATVVYDFTAVPGLTSTAPQGNQPDYLTVTSDATVPGFYQTTFQLDGSPITGTTNNDAKFLFLQNPGPIDLSATPVTSTYDILPGGIGSFSGLNNLTVTGLPTGVTFSSATGKITVTKSSASSGFYPLTFTGTSGSDVITVPMTLELQNTWTGPPAPAPASSFVGGRYSGQSCATSRGNENVVTVTGRTESRVGLLNDLVTMMSNIIRIKIDENYQDPTITDPDNLFHSEISDDYTTVLANTTQFFVGSYTGNQATAITNIVKTYFQQFRRFVLRFYNYTPSSESCGELQSPGFSTCVQDCNSNVTLNFSEI